MEALFCSLPARQKIAARQADTFGANGDDFRSEAESAALSALSEQSVQKRLAARRCERFIRDKIFHDTPTWRTLLDNAGQEISIMVSPPIVEEIAKIGELTKTGDFDGLIARYPLRETRVFSEFTKKLRFPSRKDYEQAVVVLVQQDDQLRSQLLSMFEPLTTALNS